MTSILNQLETAARAAVDAQNKRFHGSYKHVTYRDLSSPENILKLISEYRKMAEALKVIEGTSQATHSNPITVMRQTAREAIQAYTALNGEKE